MTAGSARRFSSCTIIASSTRRASCSAIAISTRSARSWSRSCCGGRAAEVLTQLPERTDNTVYVEMTEAQRGPYAEQQSTLARLLHKKYLTEMDRRRILCCIANMRMLCDSTFLFDKQTNVSPKLEEFAELVRELVGEGPHKVVVFSQWEMMLRKAAEVLDRLEDRLHRAARRRARQGAAGIAGAFPRRPRVPGFPEHRRGRHRLEPAGGRHGHQPGSAVEPGGAGAADRPGPSHGPASAGAGVQPGHARQHRGAGAEDASN